MDLKYHTSMDENGQLTATFNVQVTDYDSQDDEKNPRICLGLREKDGDSEEYDMAQMSMRKFKDAYWSAKDGFHREPRRWCSYPWEREAEEIVDWKTNLIEFAYDANARSLHTSFTRKLVGSTEKDLTLKLNTDYEYKLLFGTVNRERDEDFNALSESPNDKEYANDGVISFKDVFYDGASRLVGAAVWLTAVATCLF